MLTVPFFDYISILVDMISSANLKLGWMQRLGKALVLLTLQNFKRFNRLFRLKVVYT